MIQMHTDIFKPSASIRCIRENPCPNICTRGKKRFPSRHAKRTACILRVVFYVSHIALYVWLAACALGLRIRLRAHRPPK